MSTEFVERASTWSGWVIFAGVVMFTIGCLNVIQGSRIAGAARIVACDTQRAKLDLASDLGATDCLLIDELGYVPFSQTGAQLLFQVLAERHERKSVIVTTNLGFADWTQIFGQANLTAALLDRLTHRAEILTCSWSSYRLQDTLKQSVDKPKNIKLSTKPPQVTGHEHEG